ncbi:hypothetical protein ACOYR1_03855 [Thalassotalea piscium]
MRILIYEPLADINKAPFFSNFATKLASEGHDVVIACEQRVIYTLQGKLTPKKVINCTSTICAYIATNKSIRYTCFRPPKKTFKDLSQKTLANKLNKIAVLRKAFYTPLLQEFNPELIYIWNGQAEHQQDFVMLAKNMGFNFNYIEHGWFPQKDYYYIDPEGVNARSSIAKNEPPAIDSAQQKELDQWLDSYTKPFQHIVEKPKQILVPLQVDTDTNITLHSPFKSMKLFIAYLEENIPAEFTVILRPHPLGEYAYPITSQQSNFIVDSTTELHQLIAESEYIIGINSTVLLEGLCFRKKIISLGKGIITTHKKELTLDGNHNIDTHLLHHLIFSAQQEINMQCNLLKAHKSAIRKVKAVTFNKASLFFFTMLRALLNVIS